METCIGIFFLYYQEIMIWYQNEIVHLRGLIIVLKNDRFQSWLIDLNPRRIFWQFKSKLKLMILPKYVQTLLHRKENDYLINFSNNYWNNQDLFSWHFIQQYKARSSSHSIHLSATSVELVNICWARKRTNQNLRRHLIVVTATL
jgi:hypothetical protein